jgi:ABC-2 type transport system permease protein
MLKLIQNEWLKIFKRPGTYVMIGLLILVITIVGAVMKSQYKSVPSENPNWKHELQVQVDQTKEQMESVKNGRSDQYQYFLREIAVKEYQIAHDMNPNQEYTVWGFLNDASNAIQFAGLFVIIVAAGIVASEFNWGTIKLLLIRPISRVKILVAKYMTVLLFAVLMLLITFSYSCMIGFVLFGTPEVSVPYLNYVDGEIVEQNMLVHLIVFYGLKSISMLMLATMAFMISAVFRNSSLAIGISIFLMFAGGQLTAMLASKYEWAKYMLFANTELIQYFEGVPMVEGMTLTFSVGMLIVYFGLFQFLTYYVFKKRDVAA